MTNDVARAGDNNTVVGRMRGAIGDIRQGPIEAAFEDIVGDVVVLLVVPAMDAQSRVFNMNIADYIPYGSRRLKTNCPLRTPDRKTLDVQVASIDFEHIASCAVSAVQNSVLFTGSSDDY